MAIGKKKSERKKRDSDSDTDAQGNKTSESSRALAAEQQGEDEIENWADDPDSDAYIAALKLYPKIQKCYDNKESQGDKIAEYWNIYNAVIDENQQYTGNSSAYIPEVRNCINARVKRTIKQLFPNNRKHVDAISAESTEPYPVLSLLEHYIRESGLKQIVKSDLIAGDVTGQWNLYVDWTKTYRQIKKVIKSPKIVQVVPHDGANPMDVEMPQEVEEGDEELVDDEIITEGPDIVPFATEDLAVYPATADSTEKATATCIRLRMSQDALEQMVDEGVFVGVDAEELDRDSSQARQGQRKAIAAQGTHERRRHPHRRRVQIRTDLRNALQFATRWQGQEAAGLRILRRTDRDHRHHPQSCLVRAPADHQRTD